MLDPGHTHHRNKTKSAATQDSGSANAITTVPDQTAEPDPALMASAATSTAAPTGGALAGIIAGDAGGSSAQYAHYADNLARTLSQMTPAQRARVFGGN